MTFRAHSSRLQIALDGTLDSALEILSAVHPYVDIAEIGTPLVYREGMQALRTIHQFYPKLSLLADLKIMDAGEEESAIAFEAGASYVTVLGVTQDATIQGALHSARRYNRKIVVDMMQVANLLERGLHLIEMGCDFLCAHTAYDMQGQNSSPYHALELLGTHIDSKHLAIAGGINHVNLDIILSLTPAIVVVGGAITRAGDPVASAKLMREKIEKYARNE